MKIVCISASNTKMMGSNSTSTRVCSVIQEKLITDVRKIETEVVPLMDYELKSCFFCGSCLKNGQCSNDREFNRLQEKLVAADGIFIVIPHYSPIPSKLLMILEKINEIVYSGWLKNSGYCSPYQNKPVALIGHGGMVEEDTTLQHYHNHLVTPVADTLRSLSFDVIKYNDIFPNGAVFGLKDASCIKTVENAIFPDIIQDWPKIEKRITPLIENMLLTIDK